VRTDICVLNNGRAETYEKALSIIDDMAAHNGLAHREALLLRLIAEETLGLQKNILGCNEGEFYAENDGMQYAVHLRADMKINEVEREEFMNAATDRKNSAYQGFKGKLRMIADAMSNDELNDYAYAGIDAGIASSGEFWMPTTVSSAWSYTKYRNGLDKQSSEWDELEESILAKVADEIVVAVRNRMAEIVVVKKF
jgi:hypothetical protein